MCNGEGTYAEAFDGRGFTLVEVMFAMAVSTIALLSLALLQAAAVKGNTSSRKGTQACFLAQSIIERIEEGSTIGSTVIGARSLPDHPAGNILASGAMDHVDGKGAVGGPFNLRWQVSTHTNWSREVKVDVSWQSTLGLKRQVELSTVFRESTD